MEAGLNHKKGLIKASTMALVNTFFFLEMLHDPWQEISDVQYLFLVCDIIIMVGFYGPEWLGIVANIFILSKMGFAIIYGY
jgi:hypothetical protein